MWYKQIDVRRTGVDEIVARVVAGSDSPWFSGHFPGNPVLPGIAQLAMVADCIAFAWKNVVSMTGMSRVKFRRIVRPGESFDIYAARGKTGGQFLFRITCGDEDVCSGIMHFETQTKQ